MSSNTTNLQRVRIAVGLSQSQLATKAGRVTAFFFIITFCTTSKTYFIQIVQTYEFLKKS